MNAVNIEKMEDPARKQISGNDEGITGTEHSLFWYYCNVISRLGDYRCNFFLKAVVDRSIIHSRIHTQPVINIPI